MMRVMILLGIFTANLYLSENRKNFISLQGKAIIQTGGRLQLNSSEFFNNLLITVMLEGNSFF
jgi:hypothetical protein